MPSYNKMFTPPKPGELWTNTLVGVDGIVVGCTGTVVVLASLTGVRAPVEFNRSYNPWQKKREPPANTMPCSRVMCQNPAVAWYQRPLVDLPEAACPEHIPRGLQSTLLASGETRQCQPSVGQRCECGDEAVEVIGEIANGLRNTKMWMCCRCSLWWIHTLRDDRAIQISNLTNAMLEVVPEGYSFKQLMRSRPDALSRRSELWIQVLPKHSTVITGPKPMTLFDHLLWEDD